MWLLRTVVSSLGTYISLIGQSSTSALLSPSTRPSRTVTASGATREGMQPPVKPNADFSLPADTLLLTLTIPMAALTRPFFTYSTVACDSHRHLGVGTKQAQHFYKTSWESKLHQVPVV